MTTNKRLLMEEATAEHSELPKWVVEAAVDLYLRDKEFFATAMKADLRRKPRRGKQPAASSPAGH